MAHFVLAFFERVSTFLHAPNYHDFFGPKRTWHDSEIKKQSKMCFVETYATTPEIVLELGSDQTSPWRRFRQQMKPKLSRAVVTTAKISLNKYWAKFEQLSTNKLPLMTLFVENNPIQDNEINDNIANEKMDS